MAGSMRTTANGVLMRDYTPTYAEFLASNGDVVRTWYRAHRELQAALCLADYRLAKIALGHLEDACFLMSGAIENLRPLSNGHA